VNIRGSTVLLWAVIGVLALFVASPALSRLLVYPRTEFFTELWILDANHRTEDFPSNITQNQNCRLYLGVGNRLGHSAYYVVQVKFRNQSQPAPTSFGPIENRLPSSLSSLFTITVFVADEGVWELPLDFSFDYRYRPGYNETLSRVEFNNLVLNDVVLDLEGYTIDWDSEKSVFFGNLFYELWIYDVTSHVFQYHGRSVGIWLNMTG